MAALTGAQAVAVNLLVLGVRQAFAEGWIPEAEVECWSDLHDHVDANDFLQDIEHLNPYVFGPDTLEAFLAWDNVVVEAAELALFGKVS